MREMKVEAGLLKRKDWKAQMIGGPAEAKDKPKKPFRLRNRFNVDGQAGVAR